MFQQAGDEKDPLDAAMVRWGSDVTCKSSRISAKRDDRLLWLTKSRTVESSLHCMPLAGAATYAFSCATSLPEIMAARERLLCAHATLCGRQELNCNAGVVIARGVMAGACWSTGILFRATFAELTVTQGTLMLTSRRHNAGFKMPISVSRVDCPQHGVSRLSRPQTNTSSC